MNIEGALEVIKETNLVICYRKMDYYISKILIYDNGDIDFSLVNKIDDVNTKSYTIEKALEYIKKYDSFIKHYNNVYSIFEYKNVNYSPEFILIKNIK